jgi:ABC-type dipeptide/oligopeptide/nickel transport system ATPase component
MSSLHRETGMTIVLVTHDLHVAAEIARRHVEMRDGKIVDIRTTENKTEKKPHA